MNENDTNNGNLLEKSFMDITNSMNINKDVIIDAWQTYSCIDQNVTLEGDKLHWLACALYVSSRKLSSLKKNQDDKGIPLSKLLCNVKLSLLHFFQKVHKWIEMARCENLVNDKIEQLERNFSVSSIVFEKFNSIFKEIFLENWTETNKRGRRHLLTTKDIYKFCWTLYISTKAQYPDISDDLVNSYHLLLCCVDITFGNVVCVRHHQDAICPDFKGLPSDFPRDYSNGDVPSMIKTMCHLHEGLAIETNIIRKQYLGSYIEELIKSRHLLGNHAKKTGLLENTNYEKNMNYLNESYEQHIVSTGSIDERIFIKEDSVDHIGTPSKRLTTFTDVDEKERSQVKRNLQEYFNNAKGLCPPTPLTGRRYVENKSASTKDSSITLPVSRLQELVKGLKPHGSDNLKSLFQSMSSNPEEKIKSLLETYGDIFLAEYTKPLVNSENDERSRSPFEITQEIAKTRLHLAIVLFYKIYESFLTTEKKKNSDLTIFEQELFVKCLFTCCLEIVLYSYKSARMFPWVQQIYGLKAYQFFKIIELVIRAEELSREVIKHLSSIEEKILETLTWETGSPVFNAISVHGVPKCQDVASDSQVMAPMYIMSPTNVRLTKDRVTQSAAVNLTDQLVNSSPSSGQAKRNLFGSSGNDTALANSPMRITATVAVPSKPIASTVSTVRLPAVMGIVTPSPGASPVRLFAVTPQRSTSNSNVIRLQPSPSKSSNNSKKYGSLGIFFRKLYHMSYIRLKHLCDNLSIGPELQKKIWTCYEYSLVENIDMVRDRHIDQLLMCAIYVMSKVTKDAEKSFHEIMKHYRTQPQATSDVYRRVLIKKSIGNNEDDQQGDATGVRVKMESGTEEAVDRGSNDTNKYVYMDLIQFYNIVYIKKIKDFALKFASNKVNLDAPPLSPLPVSRKQTHSPRKISSQHKVFISPIKPTAQVTPRSKLLYCFDTDSPKKLCEINAMIKGGTRRRVNLDIDESMGPSLAKRPMNGVARRTEEIRSGFMNKH